MWLRLMGGWVNVATFLVEGGRAEYRSPLVRFNLDFRVLQLGFQFFPNRKRKNFLGATSIIRSARMSRCVLPHNLIHKLSNSYYPFLICF